jgi:EPS-associated MarR family transcriptional regulator
MINVQKLNVMVNLKKEQDYFKVLRRIEKRPDSSQRQLAEELGFSLGKLNYCLKALKKKGLVKLRNFQKKSNKINYFKYVITPKGISERIRITISFMKRIMKEYDELKNELKDNS